MEIVKENISRLRQIVDEFLLAQGTVTAEQLSDPAIKMTDLGLDSLGVVEMLFEVEDRYGIHVDDVMQFQQMTLNEVVAHMEQIVREKHGGVVPDFANPERVAP
jgi:acyl carrier protein